VCVAVPNNGGGNPGDGVGGGRPDPGDGGNVIMVGDENKGTITDNAARALTSRSWLSLLSLLTSWTIVCVCTRR
jgi:hypothetical protein